MSSQFQSIIIMVVLFAVMYFMLIRPQNKKDKQEKEMRSNLQVGDEVMTVGGIIGRVVRIKEDRVTIATGAEKTKIEFTKNAISNKLNNEPAPKGSKAVVEESAAPSPKNIKKLGEKKEAAPEVKEEVKAEEKAEEPAAAEAEK